MAGNVLPHSVDVLIVGAGPGGIAAARACQRQGTKAPSFLVCEASGSVGGVWRPQAAGGSCWAGMRTNLSAQQCHFRGTLPDGVAATDFPTAEQMYRYFQQLSAPFSEHISFHSKVRFLTPVNEGEPTRFTLSQCSWCACLKSTAHCCRCSRRPSWDAVICTSVGGAETTHTVRARFVIVATGVFSDPHVPPELTTAVCAENKRRDASAPQLQLSHSSQFRMERLVSTDSVAVVGCAFSGADMASHVAHEVKTANPVTVIVRTPVLYAPRYLPAESVPTEFKETGAVPWDFVALQPSPNPLPAEQLRSEKSNNSHTCLKAVSASLNSYLPRSTHIDLKAFTTNVMSPWDQSSVSSLELKSPGPVKTVICDTFVPDVVEGKICVVPSIQDLPFPSLTHVVSATGFRTKELGSLFPADVLSGMQYDADSLLPLVLFKSALHPVLDSLGFVGMYRGPYLKTVELQADWLVGIAVGQIVTPCEAQRAAFLELERSIRRTSGRARRCAVSVQHDSFSLQFETTEAFGFEEVPHFFPHRNTLEFNSHFEDELPKPSSTS